jgi:hypothetical protein
MLEAVAAEAYADVAAIARIAANLSHLSSPNGAQLGSADEAAELSATPLSGQDGFDPEEEPAPAPKALLRGTTRRDQYPRFLRDGDRLVKLAWSKKERAPYEHRAPREVINALIVAVQKRKGENKLFQASDILPLKNALHEEFPSYQSYLALNWLRDVGVIRKKGREGYVLRPNAATPEKLESLWTALPAGGGD